MKEDKKVLLNIMPAVILALLVLLGLGFLFVHYHYRDFGSRGTSGVIMAFDINGKNLRAGHGVYVRYGECYYLPLTETVDLLGIEEESHFRGNRVIVRLDNDSYTYYFSNGRLLKNVEEMKDCGNAFMMKERTVYISTLFLEKALNCRVRMGTDEENRIFISRNNFTGGDFDYSWAEKEKNCYIAHALGGIDGLDYSNSMEAFQESYDKGFRVFEADIEYSSDGEPVLIHSWERAMLRKLFNMDVPEDNVETPLSLREFKSQKIYEKYTPLSLSEFLDLMVAHTDMYFVIDGKFTDEENVRKEYADIVRLAKEKDPEILDRMIPQIYSEGMYEWVMQTYDWKSLIFSWYMYGSAGLEPEPLFDFCEERGIRVCAMKDALENALLDKEAFNRDLMIFVYTVNQERDRDRLFENGVKGIYTDNLSGNHNEQK